MSHMTVVSPAHTNANTADANSVTSLPWLAIHALSIQMVFARVSTARRDDTTKELPAERVSARLAKSAEGRLRVFERWS